MTKSTSAALPRSPRLLMHSLAAIALTAVIPPAVQLAHSRASSDAIGGLNLNTAALAAYEHTWQQCALVEGQWRNQGPMTEQLAIIGEDVLRLRQTSHRADGVVSEATVYFERDSFAPQRMETRVTGPDGKELARVERTLGPDGYTGAMYRDGERQPLQGKISSQMFHGGALGLPLAALGKQKKPVSFPASMMSFDATYEVQASWVGAEDLEHQGTLVTASTVDVHWRHLESGDIYPPGPDASGGRFWLVSAPPEGFPYVPAYRTDTYAVEFVPDVCPAAQEAPAE